MHNIKKIKLKFEDGYDGSDESEPYKIPTLSLMEALEKLISSQVDGLILSDGSTIDVPLRPSIYSNAEFTKVSVNPEVKVSDEPAEPRNTRSDLKRKRSFSN